ncbi:hypothetical protein BK193_04195 [Brucella melitensis]|nr:hypothetical protein BK193_04195 [Brucella melitensis]
MMGRRAEMLGQENHISAMQKADFIISKWAKTLGCRCGEIPRGASKMGEDRLKQTKTPTYTYYHIKFVFI